VSLRDEIDAWLPLVPSAEAALSTMNQNALHIYAERIRAIRKSIDQTAALHSTPRLSRGSRIRAL